MTSVGSGLLRRSQFRCLGLCYAWPALNATSNYLALVADFRVLVRHADRVLKEMQ